MAHYKRGYPRTRSRRTRYSKYQQHPNYNWMANWPRWWDVVFHTRPTRRRQQHLLATLNHKDPDDIAWPLGNHKPHNYYW